MHLTSTTSEVNIKSSTLEQILKLLTIEGFIIKGSKGYSRTLKLYTSQQNYYDSVIAMKEHEYQELLNFQQTKECQMKFLTKALDDPNSRCCGKCSTCLEGTWKWTDDKLSQEDIEKVRVFFAKSFIKIEPRKKSILTNRMLTMKHEEGIALSYYHEQLGQEASRGKYVNNHFSDVLVQASADKLKLFFREKGLHVADLIVIPIPSNRRSQLVPEFAKRLSNTLQCRYEHIFAKRPNEPEQKSFLNSSHQEQSIRDYLYVQNDVNLENQHILLVDDFVDSKWTFTVATELLGEVYKNIKVTPFALANTSGSD